MAVITGTDKVLRNLNRQIRGIQNRTKGGMRHAALVVRKRSQELTPVKTSNLKGSAGTEVYDTAKGLGAVIYYTAYYAVYVHEIDKNYRVGQWKFLETALKEKSREIVSIIRRYAKIGKRR